VHAEVTRRGFDPNPNKLRRRCEWWWIKNKPWTWTVTMILSLDWEMKSIFFTISCDDVEKEKNILKHLQSRGKKFLGLIRGAIDIGSVQTRSPSWKVLKRVISGICSTLHSPPFRESLESQGMVRSFPPHSHGFQNGKSFPHSHGSWDPWDP